MGNSKGYVPSEETRRKVSEALKKAHAEGRGRKNYVPSEETKRKQSESLKLAYAEGRMQLTGAALEQSLAPKKSEEERKARKLETQRDWRAENPETVKGYKRKYHPTYYGWTAEQYEAENEKRQGLCDICRRPQQNGFRLAIDHDHDCCPERAACDKCRRGLLCTNCNTLLGSAHDSVEILEAAISYVKKYKFEKGELPCLTHPRFAAR
jgi:hypothetical protein